MEVMANNFVTDKGMHHSDMNYIIIYLISMIEEICLYRNAPIDRSVDFIRE
jgi:hypothetical protein